MDESVAAVWLAQNKSVLLVREQYEINKKQNRDLYCWWTQETLHVISLDGDSYTTTKDKIHSDSYQ